MDFKSAYEGLKKIYQEGAYCSEVVGGIEETAAVRLIYGVVEKDYTLSCILEKLVDKNPKLPMRILLKMGIYCLNYMDGIPDYAVCNGLVELCSAIRKNEMKGFVNAVLKKACAYRYPVPADNVERICYDTSTPRWITERILRDYGSDGEKILGYKEDRLHFRINRKYDAKEVLPKVKNYEPSAFGGYYAPHSDGLTGLFRKGVVTYQSPSSMEVCKMVASTEPATVLDVCAAPGGKSVYIAELTGAKVTACDVHPHRVRLIDFYSFRMGQQNVTATVMDGTVFNKKWEGAFDTVLVDAPCSGTGVMSSKPEVKLNRKPDDIGTLKGMQLKILTNSSRYVKSGGYLVYSTCSLLKEENEDNVRDFLKTGVFELVEQKTLTPASDKTDGFFMAKLKRV